MTYRCDENFARFSGVALSAKRSVSLFFRLEQLRFTDAIRTGARSAPPR